MTIKRTSRSKVFLDLDDLKLIDYLINYSFPLSIKEIKNNLQISHAGLLTHIHRLQYFKLITIEKSKLNYKVKEYRLTESASLIHKVFKEYINLDYKPTVLYKGNGFNVISKDGGVFIKYD